MNTLSIDGIFKEYKKRPVVKNVSFKVESGNVVGLLGPNGAGKTTSFYMVVGLVTPDQGDISINEKSIRRLPMFRRARLGLSYLPQEPSIFKKLTVKENITVALEAQGIFGSEKQKRLNSLMDELKIQHLEGTLGMALSGGERRRVEIARALATEPKFLLLDEPFAGIDPIAISDLQQIIRDLKNKKIGILITDHNVRETLNICDFAYLLKDGKIEVKGSPQDISTSDVAKQFYLGKDFEL